MEKEKTWEDVISVFIWKNVLAARENKKIQLAHVQGQQFLAKHTEELMGYK